ncbi:uncharacterized protein V1518DRAFT_395387 [Limtongia smithiae]|uniref:uncharacterized protein n=1 Tax=Limtongia smithiae TaxID=1125753 RepID=UPI0034CE39D1
MPSSPLTPLALAVAGSTPSPKQAAPHNYNIHNHGLPPNVLYWDTADVAVFLEHRLGLPQYAPTFVENDITGEVLIHLSHEFLLDLDVQSVGHRLQILKAVYNLKIAQDLPIDPGEFVPLALAEQDAERDSVDIDRLMKSLEVRDRRIMLAEQEIKRLMDNYARLREDLLPIFKMVKESKPLPMPDPMAGSRRAQNPATLGSVGGGAGGGGAVRHSMFMPSLNPISPITASFPTSIAEQTTQPIAINGSTNGTSASDSQPGSPPVYHSSPPTVTQLQLQQQYRARLPSGAPSIASPLTFLSGPSTPSFASPSSPPAVSTIPTVTSTPSSSSSLPEAFKNFKLKLDDPCYKVLPAVLKGHRINADWRQYALLVCVGDQERVLGMDERPLAVFKELQDAGQQPVFMLRAVQDWTREPARGGAIVTGTPGGVL